MESNSNPAPVQSSETNPNVNSNQTVEPSSTQQDGQAPTITPEAVAEYLGTTPEGLESFTKFSKANGGLDKAFGKMKQTISNPQAQQPIEPQAQIQQPNPLNDSITQTQPVMAQQSQIPEAPKGYTSMEQEFQIAFRDRMAREYPELDKDGYIKAGDFVKEATSFGMQVVDQYGRINEDGLRKFLDLKKAAIPPEPTSSPITTTPTVTYTTVEGDITTQEQADKIMSEGSNNPQYEAALKFTRERIFGKKEEPKK